MPPVVEQVHPFLAVDLRNLFNLFVAQPDYLSLLTLTPIVLSLSLQVLALNL